MDKLSQPKTTRRFRLEYFVQIAAAFAVTTYMLVYQFHSQALLLAILFAMMSGYSLGIFHHMYLSHSVFKIHPLIEKIGVTLATLSWRGPMASPIRYAAMHRVHHQHSDQEQDPHSPIHGVWHSFMGWMWHFEDRFADPTQYEDIVPCLKEKNYLRFLDRHEHLSQAIFGLSVTCLATLVGWLGLASIDMTTAIVFGVYATFVKAAILLVLANSVDVVNHAKPIVHSLGKFGFIAGYRNFETTDLSTNSALMGLVHLGGAVSWHNNHHAKPGYFYVKSKPWEIDVYYWILRGLQSLGLASDIKTRIEDSSPSHQSLTLKELHIKSPMRAVFYIAPKVLAWFGSVAALYFVFRSGISPWLLSLPILFLVAGIALHSLGLVGHDGGHFNLSKSRIRSVYVGNFVSSFIPFHLNAGFSVSHSLHHKHTNTHLDPDLALFSPLNSVWSRLFKSRSIATRNYFKRTLDMAMGRIDDDAKNLFKMDDEKIRFLARTNIASSGAVLIVYGLLCVYFGLPMLLALLTGIVSATMISGIRPFLEHSNTDGAAPTRSRTFKSWWLDLVFGGVNYHDAHHRYQGVPSYRAKRLYEYLKQNGQSGSLEVTRLSELIPLVHHYQYGKRRD